MHYLIYMAVALGLLSLVVSIRSALLNYRLKADSLRHQFAAEIASIKALFEQAKTSLSYLSFEDSKKINIHNEDIRRISVKISEISEMMKSVEGEYGNLPDSQIIGRRMEYSIRLNQIKAEVESSELALKDLRNYAWSVTNKSDARN